MFSPALEVAIINDDTSVLSQLLVGAVRVPPYYLQTAVIHGHIETFDYLLTFMTKEVLDQALQSYNLPVLALQHDQFDMFIYLVTHHQAPFTLERLFKFNTKVKVVNFLINGLFAKSHRPKKSYITLQLHT